MSTALGAGAVGPGLDGEGVALGVGSAGGLVVPEGASSGCTVGSALAPGDGVGVVVPVVATAGTALDQSRTHTLSWTAAVLDHVRTLVIATLRCDGAATLHPSGRGRRCTEADGGTSQPVAASSPWQPRNAQIATKEAEILSLTNRVAPLLTQMNGSNEEISAEEAKIAALQAQMTSLDGQLTAAKATLAGLEAKKGQNKDAIASQKAVVLDLQSKLGSVQKQIAAIDAQIALGGCVAM